MSVFGGIDWYGMFASTTPLLEIFVRGTLVYLALFSMLRIILKRQSGTIGITDLLLVVLIADAAQNAMAGGYSSVTDGVLLVGVIIFWNYFLDWLGYRFTRINRLVHPPPLLLVKDGRMIRANMRRELVTVDELMSQLREQGVRDVGKVKEAYMEGNGRFSVITRDEAGPEPRRKKRRKVR